MENTVKVEAKTRGKLQSLIRMYVSGEENESPLEISFNEDINSPHYKIVIQECVKDFFIDSRGVKWVREKE